MKKIIAFAVAAIMLALLCTGCCFLDPLVVSTRYASKFCGKWTAADNFSIKVGKDDDTIGYIDYTLITDDGLSKQRSGSWRMESTTLTVYRWPSKSSTQSDSETDEGEVIVYNYANGLNDDIIEKGNDAIQLFFERANLAHLWYASDKYLCLDDMVFTRVKN